MKDRYSNNSESVRKISRRFGYVLTAFEPDWVLTKTLDSSERKFSKNSDRTTISDSFMEMLALSLNLPWEFEISTKTLQKQIQTNREAITFIKKLPHIDWDVIKIYQDSIEELTSEINSRKKFTAHIVKTPEQDAPWYNEV